MMKTTYLLILLIAATTWLGCAKEKTVDTGSTVPQAVSITNVAYGADALQKMDVYLPQGRSADSTKVLLLIHGGGWVEGDKSDFAAFVDTIKKRLPGYAIFNINYRLSAFPANVFPTQELDIKAAVNFIDS
jgi:acetyl esterase/lipase